VPDVTERLSTALADRYRIERELGQGGMATVYLAEDLRHKRKVALKVLKPELAAVLGAERFVQEITTTASLQHPHILPLFDSGRAGGQADGRRDEFLYYVMPYIEGETLRDKLTRETQLGIEEAMKITTEVADALDYAHRHGVVHRDIKPENILLHDGRPMVADFGIALAVSAAAGGRMTETGLSLGTPHYMSPEQATAEKEITGRSDLYSLASVLYEMLTGQPPHHGGSAQQIIMKIIAEPVQPVTTLRKSVPPNVAAAVAKALEKLPADRFGTARAFADALTNPGFAIHGTAASRAGAATPGWRGRATVPALIAAGVFLVVAVLGWLRREPDPPVSRHEVRLWRQPLDPFLLPGIERHAVQAAIAPDGSSVVFSDSSGGGVQLLRKLRHEHSPVPLAGTEGGMSPFFSPDGLWVGYVTTDGKLRKAPVAGGGSITLSEDAHGIYMAGAWLDDNTIVYVAAGAEIRRISADGGPVRAVPGTNQGRLNFATLWPLPASRGFLYTACEGNCSIGSDIYVHDLAADTSRLLIAGAAGAWYAPTGHLLYTDRAGGLYAMAFDPERLEGRSGAIPVVDGVAAAKFTLSTSGAALYSVGADEGTASELVWVSRDGTAEPLAPGWQGVFEYPALSPDGKALAVSLREGATHLWIWRADGTRQRLTRDGTVNWRPAWAPDGRSVAFVSNREGRGGRDDLAVFQAPADGSAPPKPLLRHSAGVWEAEISRDGQWLIIRADEGGDDANIRARRLTGDTALIPLLVDSDLTMQAALRPDGRWLAFVSDVSGRREVYVASFPDMASIRLVSNGGGLEPRWARDGRELFFKSGGNLVAVDVPPGLAFAPGLPRVLFPVGAYRIARNRQQYDVSPDGRRFVMIRDVGGRADAEIVYVENWFEELKAKVKR
jgi:serine/threonine-protein kinase